MLFFKQKTAYEMRISDCSSDVCLPICKPRTLFDKIWDNHVVDTQSDGTCVIYIDRHLVHEVPSPQAFDGLRLAGRRVRRPDAPMAGADPPVPTPHPRPGTDDPEPPTQAATVTTQVQDFGDTSHPP